MDDVEVWLSEIGLEPYSQAFQGKRVGGGYGPASDKLDLGAITFVMIAVFLASCYSPHFYKLDLAAIFLARGVRKIGFLVLAGTSYHVQIQKIILARRSDGLGSHWPYGQAQ